MLKLFFGLIITITFLTLMIVFLSLIIFLIDDTHIGRIIADKLEDRLIYNSKRK